VHGHTTHARLWCDLVWCATDEVGGHSGALFMLSRTDGRPWRRSRVPGLPARSREAPSQR
jgi:hypothetical protein